MARLGPPIFLGVFTVLAIVLLTGGASDDRAYRDTFQLDATYHGTDQETGQNTGQDTGQNTGQNTGHVEISFSDRSGKTSSAVLEVLGMPESFQKTYHRSEFVERVEFAGEPRYGWSVHPIVLQVDHKEFGHVELKTEVRPAGEPAPPVIYSAP